MTPEATLLASALVLGLIAVALALLRRGPAPAVTTKFRGPWGEVTFTTDEPLSAHDVWRARRVVGELGEKGLAELEADDDAA